MAKVISIGKQGFSALREHDYFFVDKTNLIKEWWENGDAIITEFKVYEPDEEKTLQDAVQSALHQIAEKNYDAERINRIYPETLMPPEVGCGTG